MITTKSVRIIPCLDVIDDSVVKGTRFSNLIQYGLASDYFKKYENQEADEIIILDIAANQTQNAPFKDQLKKITKNKMTAVTAGGGILNLEQAKTLFDSGADKVSLNSVLYDQPQIVTELVQIYGSQAVVCAIDYKKIDNKVYCVKKSGKIILDINPIEHARNMVDAGCGEILLTSFNQDGTNQGYDLETLDQILNKIKVPVIVSGGAGLISDLVDAARLGASGLLVAGKLHRNEWTIPEIKAELIKNGLNVRPYSSLSDKNINLTMRTL